MITYNYMRLCVYDVIHIWTYDLRDTGAMLYQLSYEALPEAGQEQVQFVPVIWREWEDVHMM